mgnify:FL=1
MKNRKKEQEETIKITKIKDIIIQNKNLPLNEIKRKVKQEFPHINIEKLSEIITSKGLLRDSEREGER